MMYTKNDDTLNCVVRQCCKASSNKCSGKLKMSIKNPIQTTLY